MMNMKRCADNDAQDVIRDFKATFGHCAAFKAGRAIEPNCRQNAKQVFLLMPRKGENAAKGKKI